ncbi:MAG: Rieske (2Fe-2S) protein [Geodermatophilaceae bacterium]
MRRCGCRIAGCSSGDQAAERSSQKTLGSTSDIPVGGGTVFADQEVVVTQPTAGAFRAFSAICTHRGCTVNEVVDGTINCPCHGSKYSAADGSVVTGPAQMPLPRREVTVEGGSLKLV